MQFSIHFPIPFVNTIENISLFPFIILGGILSLGKDFETSKFSIV